MKQSKIWAEWPNTRLVLKIFQTNKSRQLKYPKHFSISCSFKYNQTQIKLYPTDKTSYTVSLKCNWARDQAVRGALMEAVGLAW